MTSKGDKLQEVPSSPNSEYSIFRAVGFTDAAAEYPRNELALAMFAAFNGVAPEQLSEGMRYFPNPSTQKAWNRVAEAARAHVLAETASLRMAGERTA